MSTFKVVGTGDRKVLLFPGLMGTQNAFDPMLEFADRDAFQYAAMDYRGYGAAKNEKGLWSLKEVVLDAVRIIDHLRWTEFSVAGHSLGALAAQMLAVAMPHRVKSIISLAGLDAGGVPPDEKRRERISAAARSLEKRVAMVESGTGGSYTKAFARAVASATWNDIDPDAFASYGRSAEIDIRQQVEGSAIPILAIVGELDPANTADKARATTLKWYRNSRLEVFPRVGHYPMIEAPAATITALENFIAL